MKTLRWTVIMLWSALLLCLIIAAGYAIFAESKVVDQEQRIVIIEDGPELRRLHKAALENIGRMGNELR